MEKQTTPLLEAVGICKYFPSPCHREPITVLNDIHLQLLPGEAAAIVGRSGEGKSSLLHILGTLDAPSKGTLKIANQLVSAHNEEGIRNRMIGFVFQSFHLLEDYTVLENVLMPARIRRRDVKKSSPAFERAMGLLEEVGLSHRAHFSVNILSGGEKQRVALARAMCNDPAILCADEPSGNLDRETAHLIHEILFQFVRREGKGLILVTHDRELANLCSKHYELKNGKLLTTPKNE